MKMKLKSIEIQGLFDLFNYRIDLSQDDNLTIITGFNGYGKTTVLNIVYNLFNHRFFYFQKLVFSKLTLVFENGYRLEIKKSADINKKNELSNVAYRGRVIDKEQIINCKISFYLYNEINTNIGTFEYTGSKTKGIGIGRIERFIPFIRRISSDEWLDERNARILGLDELLSEFSTEIPLDILHSLKNHGIHNNVLLDVFDSLKVYLIKEQRLIKQYNVLPGSGDNFSFVNTIQEYAKELGDLIKNKQVQSLQINQKLDSSFPKRLLDYDTVLHNEDFVRRFEILKNKYEQLQRFGLITNSLDVPPYDEKIENAKVLSVYLSDSEEKAAVFDDLLNRIELFTDILNQKRFAFKSIQIDIDYGFVFTTNNGKALALTDLSSGEQHEVVLLYELLFRVQPGTLVLIDEPEISLHVSWQQEFINDLIKIAKMQQISFIIATHSPTIINNRFDLTVDLFELSNNT